MYGNYACILQTHYNNPSGSQQLPQDASGFKLSITPQLRPYDLGVMTLGQTRLELPPGQSDVKAVPSVSGHVNAAI